MPTGDFPDPDGMIWTDAAGWVRAPGELGPSFKYNPEKLSLSIVGPSLDDARLAVASALAKDAEGKLRQALIELGWTPPAS